VRGFSFEIRADAELGERARTGRQSPSSEANGNQSATGIKDRENAVPRKSHFGTASSSRQENLVGVSTPDPSRGSIQKKLSWVALAKGGRAQTDQT
jgi:hypothetical protein